MDKRPIRVLRIIARLNIGGPAIQAIMLTSELNSGPFVSRLVAGQVGVDEGDMAYLADEKGVKPFIIPGLGREISAFSDLKSFLAIRRMIKEFRPDIIHTHTAKAGTLGRLAGFSVNLLSFYKNPVRLIHTYHGHVFHSYFGFFKSFIFRMIEKILSILTDCIVVISYAQKDDICNRYSIASESKVRVVPLGFDLWEYKALSNSKEFIRNRYFNDLKEDSIVIGIVGRLVPIKNHRMFINSITYLRDSCKHVDLKFLIVGDGELKEDLIAYTKELGVDDLVSFTGWHMDMGPLYAGMDIVTISSLNEGTPVTLIEAMAAGKPVVATEVGGIPDILGAVESDKKEDFKIAWHGILVPSGKSDIMAKAIKYLVNNKDIAQDMGLQGREYVLEAYSLNRLADDIKMLYMELVN